MSNLVDHKLFIEALHNLVSGRFSISNRQVTFHDGDTLPSDKIIQGEIDRLDAEYDANQYQRDRQYPELGEQLDMLFHDMTAGKGDKTGEWYKAVAKVKSDNPKPTE